MFDIDTLRQYIITNEGWRNHVYDDGVGNPTIGVGFNLNRPDARALINSLGLSYTAVRNGEVDLTNEQILILLNGDLATAINLAASVFPNLGQISSTRQVVLIDMTFNLGNRIRGFQRLIRAVAANDWEAAASEMQNSRWYTQVGRRGRWGVQAMRTNTLPNFLPEKPKDGSEGSENKEGSEGSETSERKETSDGSEESERTEESERKEEKDRSEDSETSEDSERKEEKDGSDGSERKEEKDGSEDSERSEGSEGSEGKETIDSPLPILVNRISELKKTENLFTTWDKLSM